MDGSCQGLNGTKLGTMLFLLCAKSDGSVEPPHPTHIHTPMLRVRLDLTRMPNTPDEYWFATRQTAFPHRACHAHTMRTTTTKIEDEQLRI